MQYIVHKNFHGKTIAGEVDIPVSTVCETVNNWIFYNGKPVCSIMSAIAHRHFAVNGDGCGLRRGNLTTAIQDTLNRRDDKENWQERWDMVWNDELCQKYRRKEHKDHWLWNHGFYNAKIDDLVYIANLIGAEEDT